METSDQYPYPDDLEKIKQLIESGVDINSGYDDGKFSSDFRLLSGAAVTGNFEIFKYLVENGADTHESEHNAFFLAISCGHIDIVEYLLMKGVDIECQSDDGDTALISASAVGKLDIVKLLISKGAKITPKNKKHETALFRACLEGHIDVVKYLVELGADTNIKNIDGKTMMECIYPALLFEHFEILEYLENV